MDFLIYAFIFTLLIFFTIIIYLLFKISNMKSSKNELTKEIIEEIDEYLIAKLDKIDLELLNKKNEIKKELGNEVKNEILKEKKIFEEEKEIKNIITKLKIEPKKSDFKENNKAQIKKLYSEGYSVEEITKRTKMHKGYIETILNINNYKELKKMR